MTVPHEHFAAIEAADRAGVRLTAARRHLKHAREAGDQAVIRKRIAAVSAAERSYSHARLQLARQA